MAYVHNWTALCCFITWKMFQTVKQLGGETHCKIRRLERNIFKHFWTAYVPDRAYTRQGSERCDFFLFPTTGGFESARIKDEVMAAARK